jgi:hypothetical protein
MVPERRSPHSGQADGRGRSAHKGGRLYRSGRSSPRSGGPCHTRGSATSLANAGCRYRGVEHSLVHHLLPSAAPQEPPDAAAGHRAADHDVSHALSVL